MKRVAIILFIIGSILITLGILLENPKCTDIINTEGTVGETPDNGLVLPEPSTAFPQDASTNVSHSPTTNIPIPISTNSTIPTHSDYRPIPSHHTYSEGDNLSHDTVLGEGNQYSNDDDDDDHDHDDDDDHADDGKGHQDNNLVNSGKNHVVGEGTSPGHVTGVTSDNSLADSKHHTLGESSNHPFLTADRTHVFYPGGTNTIPTKSNDDTKHNLTNRFGNHLPGANEGSTTHQHPNHHHQHLISPKLHNPDYGDYTTAIKKQTFHHQPLPSSQKLSHADVLDSHKDTSYHAPSPSPSPIPAKTPTPSPSSPLPPTSAAPKPPVSTSPMAGLSGTALVSAILRRRLSAMA